MGKTLVEGLKAFPRTASYLHRGRQRRFRRSPEDAEVLHGATTRAVTLEPAGTAEVFQVGPGTAFGVAADPGMPFFVGDRDIHPPEGVAI